MWRGLFFALVMLSSSADATDYLKVGSATRPPVGWTEFCTENPGECVTGPYEARDVVMSPTAWNDLNKVNTWVNKEITAISDFDHWGVIEKWSIPTDGSGDCEDYVLYKRKILIKAGWPRSALLVTVVRDKRGEGHAILTVKTDKGEFALDNQNENIFMVADTGYKFIKRQSQTDEHIWISLSNETAPAIITGKPI